MTPVERQAAYPPSYSETFADVFDYYDIEGQSEFEWGYGKTDRYKVTCTRGTDRTEITLASIRYDGDWNPMYTPVYQVIENSDDRVHSAEEGLSGRVPTDVLNIPELVLRSILHNVQTSVRLRLKNGLK